MNSESICNNCGEWINQSWDCPYCGIEANYWKYGSIQEKKKSTVACPKCSFQNDLQNQHCVACDCYIYESSEKKNKCQICGQEVYQHLFNDHSTNCFLSNEEVKKYQQQIKAIQQIEKYQETLEKCKHCEILFPKELMDDHFQYCEKKPPIPKKIVSPKLMPKPKTYKGGHRLGLQPIKPIIKAEQNIYAVINDGPIFEKQFNQSEILIPSEIARVTNLQKTAILHMQKLSQVRHNKSLVQFQKKANRLGYKKNDIQNLQFYIQNYAPIIVQIHILKHMEFFINDTHYRNQFETGKSSGSLSRQSRTQWQNRLFDNTYKNAKDFERVKYGVINFTNDPKGVNCAVSYGPSYLLLKQHVRNRCTITDMDSSNANCQVGTFKYCFHVLNKLTNQQMKSAFRAAQALQESSTVTKTYKQIQIQGPIQFAKDVERIYVSRLQVKDKKFLDMTQIFSEKFGVEIQFI